MKRTLFSVFTMASLLVAGCAMLACDDKDSQKEVEEISVDDPQIPAQTFTMVVNAIKGGDQTTRALTLDDENHIIVATWSADDVVKAYKGEDYLCDLTPTDISVDGTEATLKGDFTGKEIAESDVLTLKFLSDSYSSQDGTLNGSANSIDKVCDYAIATVTVSSITGSSIYTTDAEFANQQAIVKFTLVDKADPTVDVEALSLVVTVGSITYTVTPSSATNELWVAIPAIENEAISLEATTDGGPTYTFDKSGVTFANEKYYEITVNMKKPATVTTAPTIKSGDLTYNRENQALVEYGAAAGGTIFYYLTPTTDAPSASDLGWATTAESLPATTYHVWYLVEADENHTSTEAITYLGEKEIAPAEVVISGIVASNKEYMGTTTTTDAVLNYGSVTFGGKYDGDDLSVTADGVFTHVSVGPQTVNISNYQLSGSSSDNYVVASSSNQTTATADVIAFLNVTSSQKGYYVCTDSSYYAPTQDVLDGKTVAGMIAYVSKNGNGDDEPGEGLIIARSDAYNDKAKHSDMLGYCSSYSVGSGNKIAWRMPTQEDLMNMGATDSSNNLSPLLATLVTRGISGVTNLKDDVYYWSSTEVTDKTHRYYQTKDHSWGTSKNKNTSAYGRACAAF